MYKIHNNPVQDINNILKTLGINRDIFYLAKIALGDKDHKVTINGYVLQFIGLEGSIKEGISYSNLKVIKD